MKLKHISIAALAAAVVGLAACGGSSEPADEEVVLPSQSGVLLDSAVAGVAYLTSGGYSGVTDSTGLFRYNTGETVTFSLGNLTLGEVDAASTITPIQLAGNGPDAANIVTNLLILLQSLDADGDPENGITINAATAAAASAAAGALDLTVAPATFAADNALISLLNSAGLSTTPVDPDSAKEHFRTQFLNQLVGTWNWVGDGKDITFEFGENGAYTHTETGPAEGDGQSGTEVGILDWDPVTGQIISVSISSDTNGSWGLTTVNDPDDHAYARILGNVLFIADRDHDGREFTRVP